MREFFPIAKCHLNYTETGYMPILRHLSYKISFCIYMHLFQYICVQRVPTRIFNIKLLNIHLSYLFMCFGIEYCIYVHIEVVNRCSSYDCSSHLIFDDTR